MPETPTFPILPPDQRFLSRLERSRSGTPSRRPAGQPPGADRQRASSAAVESLRRYMRRPGYPPRTPEPAARPRGPSVHDRLPAVSVAPICTFAASAVLAFELAFLLTCRPELHPRLARGLLITPIDVRKTLAVRRTLTGVAAGVYQTFRRRAAS